MLGVVDSLDGKGASSFLGFTPIKTAVVDDDNKVTDDVPSPHISKCGHRMLVSVYFMLLIGYLSYAIYQYVERPEVETYSQQPASNFPAPSVSVKLQCFNNPNCGVITLSKNYTTAAQSHCKGRVFNVQDVTPMKLDMSIMSELCYVDEDAIFSVNTGELLATPGLVLDFSRITNGENNTEKAYAAVLVEIGDMKKLVTMDTWQVKTFYIGMSVTLKDGERKISYYAQNLQYDGKRPTWRATYIIRLAQFANVYEVTRPGSWVDILAQLGGAATLVAAVLLLAEPLFAKIFPGGESRLERGRMYRTRGGKFSKLKNADESKNDDSQSNSSLPTNPLPPIRPQFNTGDSIQIVFDGEWHPATVTAVKKGGALDVLWGDGTVSTNVPPSAAKRA